MRRALSVSLALLGAVLVSCEDDPGENISGTPGYLISRVEVLPLSATMLVPDTARASDIVQLNAVVTGKSGLPISARAVWTSTAPLVASVDSNGVVHAHQYGAATITASVGRQAFATILVAPAVRRVTIVPATDTIIVGASFLPGDTLRYRAIGFDPDDAPLTGVRFIWSSTSTAVATVDSAGVVRARGLGPAVITARAGDVTTTANVFVRRPGTNAIEK